MKRNWSYLKYILRHKWYVLIAGIKIGAPIMRLLKHDLSKFRRKEWEPYAYMFYNDDGSDRKYKPNEAFDIAWLKHIHKNPHHWQYWNLKKDSGDIRALCMPGEYALEMVADWMGAGKAISGKWDYRDWYKKNSKNMLLHPITKSFVEEIMNKNVIE